MRPDFSSRLTIEEEDAFVTASVDMTGFVLACLEGGISLISLTLCGLDPGGLDPRSETICCIEVLLSGEGCRLNSSTPAKEASGRDHDQQTGHKLKEIIPGQQQLR